MARKKKEEQVVAPTDVVAEVASELLTDTLREEGTISVVTDVVYPVTEDVQEVKPKKQKEDPNAKRLKILKELLTEHSVSKQTEPERVSFFLSVIDGGGTVAILDNKRVAYLYKLAPEPRGRKAINSKGNVKLVLNDFV